MSSRRRAPTAASSSVRLLGRRELVVHDQHLRGHTAVRGLQLLELPLPTKLRGSGRRGAGRPAPREPRQPCGSVRRAPRGAPPLPSRCPSGARPAQEPTLELRTACSLQLRVRHGRKYAPPPARYARRDERARRPPRQAHARTVDIHSEASTRRRSARARGSLVPSPFARVFQGTRRSCGRASAARSTVARPRGPLRHGARPGQRARPDRRRRRARM